MTKTKKSNLTFHPIPLEKQKRGEGCNSEECVTLEHVYWKGKPFLRIVRDDYEHNYPTEAGPYFIQSLQEDVLRYKYSPHTFALVTARLVCLDIARDFEKFLNEWHNTKKVTL